MYTESTSFFSGPGYRLAAFLTLPSDTHGSNKFPGVVLCQGPGGYGSTFITDNDGLMVPIAEWLAKAGYASLRFYYRGVGRSEGPLYRIIPMEQVEDVISAVSYMQSRPEIDSKRIGLLGVAIGGSHASVVAAIDRRVKCIVSINGMSNWYNWLRPRHSDEQWQQLLEKVETALVDKSVNGEARAVDISEVMVPEKNSDFAKGMKIPPPAVTRLIALESLLPMIAYAPEEFTSRISPRAGLWIGAVDDKLVRNEEMSAMYRNAGEPKRLELIEGETHHGLYRGEGLQKVMALAGEWFDKYL